MIALASSVAGAGWMVGQVCRDRWAWSQLLFWLPPLAVVALLASGVVLLRGLAPPGRWRERTAAALTLCAAFAAVRFLWTEVGWSWRGAVPAGAVTVTHWNPQWPGQRSLEAGRALAAEIGDVAVITSPGAMLRSSVWEEWLPEGFEGRDLGAVAVVARGRILDARMVGTRVLSQGSFLWAAWFDVAVPGARITILAIDLPSFPGLPRAVVAGSLAELLADARLPGPPDLVLGDFNCTPGSMVFDALAVGPLEVAPPWRCSGWLGTYPRPWSPLRIDAMLAGTGVRWSSYRTIDLGIGKHRAQQGVVIPERSD